METVKMKTFVFEWTDGNDTKYMHIIAVDEKGGQKLIHTTNPSYKHIVNEAVHWDFKEFESVTDEIYEVDYEWIKTLFVGD